MIFAAKNEEGTPTWELVKSGKKRATSRVKLVHVGKTIAVQPGRGKKSICKVKIISCLKRSVHYRTNCIEKHCNLKKWKQDEAELEGFLSWDGLMQYFEEHKLDFMDLYRLEFVIVGGEE